MLRIEKVTKPHSLLQWEKQATSCHPWNDMPGSTRDDLRKSLITEQRHLCAYCMTRIKHTVGKPASTKIDHFLPQEKYPGKILDYENLFAVCKGGEGKPPRLQTCDTRKGNKELTFSLLRLTLEEKISYESGTGKLIFPDHQNEVDDILNLNLKQLCDNRKEALKVY